jgi:hypothetical protein
MLARGCSGPQCKRRLSQIECSPSNHGSSGRGAGSVCGPKIVIQAYQEGLGVGVPPNWLRIDAQQPVVAVPSVLSTFSPDHLLFWVYIAWVSSPTIRAFLAHSIMSNLTIIKKLITRLEGFLPVLLIKYYSLHYLQLLFLNQIHLSSSSSFYLYSSSLSTNPLFDISNL